MKRVTKEKGWRNCAGAARPDLEINLACGRALIAPAVKERVRALLHEGLDWPAALAIAERHRLSPVVYEVLAGSARDLIPPAALNALRQAAAPSMTAGMVLLRELLHLYPLFEAAQIPVIPYKGPVLAWIAYGNFLRREYLDLDFVVQQKYIPDVVMIMKSAGYCPQFDPPKFPAHRA